MITGSVTGDREAVIHLSVRGPTGRRQVVEAVIDTGFDGHLCLPGSVIRKLELRWLRRGTAELADGTEVGFSVYDAVVTWDKHHRHVFVDEADTAPLVGMAMLAGYHLGIDVRTKGRVEITKLS